MTKKPQAGWKDISKPPEPIKQSYQDDAGLPRVVFVPPGEDPRMGIPASLDLSPLFGHMPLDFQRDFYAALHAQGLIEPADFFKPDSAERYRRALFTVIKHDFLNVQALAHKELHNG